MAKTALDGKRLNAFGMDPDKMVIVGIDTNDGADHVLWDERINLPLKEEMVLNIMAVGVKQTITVRKDGDNALVVDGRQRVRHAREANKRLRERGEPIVLVPTRVEKGSDDMMDMVSVSLNAQRQEDSTLAKARRAKRMLDRNGGDYEPVALAFGVSTKAVRNWESLLDTSPKVQKAVEAGQISASAATKLSGLARKEQEDELEKLLEDGGKATTAKAARAASSRKNGHSKSAVPSKKVLRTLLKKVDEGEFSDVNEDLLRGIRVAVGDIEPTEVPGLATILHECGYEG